MANAENGQATNAEKAILKQIEYYFGNVNLQRDKFLQDEMKKDHGWVPVDVLLTFNRLKILSNEKDVIVKAVKPSEIVDVSEDGEKIRRNPDVPIPENSLEFWDEVKTRTVYVKGFEQETTKLDDVLEYLKPYGTVQNVVMRKTKEPKLFKGSVFATFSTVEEAQKLAQSEDAKKFKDKDMTLMMQKDYWIQSVAKSKQRRQDIKALKEQKKIEALQEEHAALMSATFVKGQVLLAKNFPNTSNYTEAKEFFSKYSPAGFIEIDNEKHEARVRFQTAEEDVAKEVLKKITESGEKPVYMNQELELSVLEGDEESQYWAEFNKAKAYKYAHRTNNRNKRASGGKQQRGGRNNKRNQNRNQEAESDAMEEGASGDHGKNKRSAGNGELLEAKKAKVDTAEATAE